jgi:hypothetical protein
MKTVAIQVRRRRMGEVAAWCRENAVPILIRHRRTKAKSYVIGDGVSYTGEVSRFAGGGVYRAPNRPTKSLRFYLAVVRDCDELVFQLRWGPFPVIPYDEYKGIVSPIV